MIKTTAGAQPHHAKNQNSENGAASPEKIRFSCPHCRRALRTDARLAGKNGRCPGCSNQFQVPRKRKVNRPLQRTQKSHKNSYLVGGATAAGVAVLVLGIWVATALFGSNTETHLRERSGAFWADLKEDPSAIVDYIRFDDPEEAEQVRKSMKKGAGFSISVSADEKLQLEKIEVSGNQGTTLFKAEPIQGKTVAIEMEWTYDRGEWYLETSTMGHITEGEYKAFTPKFNIRDAILSSARLDKLGSS